MTFYAQCVTYTKCWNVLIDACAILWQIIKEDKYKNIIYYIYIHSISNNATLDKLMYLNLFF